MTPALDRPALGPHTLDVRVYYEDTDAGGMMYHARYLAFAERARAEMLRAAGVAHDELVRDAGLMFVVRRARIDYLRPVRLDALLTIVSIPRALRAASAALRQDFVLAGQLVARLDVDLACVRGVDGRPQRIPERWRRALEEMLDGPDG